MRTATKLYQLREFLDATGVTRRTLRVYEEVGLVTPAAEEEGSWLYAEESVETVQRIQRLRSDLGVNLAGVQVILEMRRKMEDLQRSLDEVVQFVQSDLRHELEHYLRREEKAVIPVPLTRPPAPREDDGEP
ncbi:MAG: MerR family transcriptional regulator [Deferrisomatales bacterium]